jgi:hypothetical protein
MIVTPSRCRRAILLASIVMLAGCGAEPVTSTSVVSSQTTTTPPPASMETTTTTTNEAVEVPEHIARVHHKPTRYATHHHRAPSVTSDSDRTVTTDTTVTPGAVSPTTTVKTTETTTSVH